MREIIRYKVRRSSDGKYATGSNPFRRVAWGKGVNYLRLEDAKRCAWTCRYQRDYYDSRSNWGEIELVRITFHIANQEVLERR